MRWIVFFVAVIGGAALDLATKAWAFSELTHTGDTRPVIDGWFSFTRAVNEGAAFGLFQGQHTFFMLVSVAAFVAVPYFVHTATRRPLLTATVLGLILAGVVGNFWDRVVLGHVRDFLDVHTPETGAVHDFFDAIVGRTVWPTFNVADIFITCGAIVMVIFFGGEGDEVEEDEGAPAEGPEAMAAAAEKDAAPAGGAAAEEPASEPAPSSPPEEEGAASEPAGESEAAASAGEADEEAPADAKAGGA